MERLWSHAGIERGCSAPAARDVTQVVTQIQVSSFGRSSPEFESHLQITGNPHGGALMVHPRARSRALTTSIAEPLHAVRPLAQQQAQCRRECICRQAFCQLFVPKDACGLFSKLCSRISRVRKVTSNEWLRRVKKARWTRLLDARQDRPTAEMVVEGFIIFTFTRRELPVDNCVVDFTRKTVLIGALLSHAEATRAIGKEAPIGKS